MRRSTQPFAFPAFKCVIPRPVPVAVLQDCYFWNTPSRQRISLFYLEVPVATVVKVPLPHLCSVQQGIQFASDGLFSLQDQSLRQRISFTGMKQKRSSPDLCSESAADQQNARNRTFTWWRHYNYQNALRQAIVFCIFCVCEESLLRDTNLHNKDWSEMHSGRCSQMTSPCICPTCEKPFECQPRAKHHLRKAKPNHVLKTIFSPRLATVYQVVG